MTNAVIVTMLPALFPLLASVVTSALVWLTLKAVSALSTNAKTQALAQVASVFGDALEAAATAAGGAGGKPTPQILALALAAAKAHLVTSWPTIETALGCELDVLLNSHAALAAGQAVTAPGGTTVSMPKPAGFARLGILLLLAAGLILTGLLLRSRPAYAQTTVLGPPAPASVTPPAAVTAVAPPALNLSPLANAFRIPWGGGTPFEVAPGAGFQVSWNVPGTWWTLPVIGSVPALALGGFVLGSVQPANTSTSYALSFGVLATICHMIGIGIGLDAVNGGPGLATSGFLAGRVSTANAFGMVSYTQQIGSAAELNLAPASP